MELKDRIAMARKKLGLTQDEFGRKIGVARNTVANYETGFRTPKLQTLISISREFNIDVDWLETGRGDMFLTVPEDAIDDFAVEFGLTETAKEFISEFVKFSPSEQEELLKLLRRLFGNKSSETEK